MAKNVVLLIAGLFLATPFALLAGAADEGAQKEEMAVAVGKYQEAPMLAALVAAGKLPPLAERIPENPSVLEPLEEIGRYGGTARVFATGPNSYQDMMESSHRGTYLGKVLKDGSITGDLAERFELSPDQKSFTIWLRKGTKWSDGAPFTVDDIIFMFEDMHRHEEVSTWFEYRFVERLVKLDDYAVRMESDEPMPAMPLKLVTFQGGNWMIFHPKHYLVKWHGDYNPDADKLAKEEGFDTWAEAFHSHFWWSPLVDMNKPTTHAWRFLELTPARRVFERNPYYWKVDTAGNQLPYMDRIESTTVAPDVYTLKIISGEADLAYAVAKLEDYALYKENEAQGNYRVTLLNGTNGSEVGVSLNLNHPEQWRAELYQDVRFRRALSLAINREEVSEAVYFGLAVPRQTTTLAVNSYYKSEWATTYAEYDPDRANRILDEVGLTDRDRDRFRIAPDGETLQIVIEFPGPRVATETMELLKEYWQAVGVKVLLKPMEPSLFGSRRPLNKHDARASGVDNEEATEFAMGAEYFSCFRARGVGTTTQWTPCGSNFAWGHAWGKWLAADAAIKAGTHTLADFEGGEMPGDEPPEEIKQLDAWGERWVDTEYGSSEYLELAEKIFDFQAENLFIIGLVGLKPAPFVARKNIGNIPTKFILGQWGPPTLNYYSDQFFYRS